LRGSQRSSPVGSSLCSSAALSTLGGVRASTRDNASVVSWPDPIAWNLVVDRLLPRGYRPRSVRAETDQKAALSYSPARSRLRHRYGRLLHSRYSSKT